MRGSYQKKLIKTNFITQWQVYSVLGLSVRGKEMSLSGEDSESLGYVQSKMCG